MTPGERIQKAFENGLLMMHPSWGPLITDAMIIAAWETFVPMAKQHLGDPDFDTHAPKVALGLLDTLVSLTDTLVSPIQATPAYLN